jgi:hypothetical protein
MNGQLFLKLHKDNVYSCSWMGRQLGLFLQDIAKKCHSEKSSRHILIPAM